MASMDSAPTKVSTVLEDQQSLLNSELMNEVLEIKCSNASRPSSGVQSGLRHRSPNSPMECSVVNDDDAQEKCSLLGERTAATSKGDPKPQDGFAKCLKKYFSVCRSNLNTMLGRKPRKAAKSKIITTLPQNTQMDSEGEDNSNVPCIGQSCWRGLRKKLGSVIKIEEETATSVPRSVRYYT